MFQLSIDVGGTFTDFVLLSDDGCFEVAKVASKRESPTESIKAGIETLNINMEDVATVYYGSTVGVNALIQQEGTNCALITTRGFRDVYAIGRLSKKEMYNMFEKKYSLLIPRSQTIEIDERVDSDGHVLKPVDANEVLEKLGGFVNEKKIESVAVCLINSYANPVNEVKIQEVLNKHFPDVYCSISTNLIQQWYEFERTCSTVLNAYITPVTVQHIQELQQLFSSEGFRGSLLVMQSNGSVSNAEICCKQALTTLNSGPAAGVAGGVELGKSVGYENIVTVDMGGTSFDVGVCDRGEVRMSAETTILKHDTLLPSLDICSIGAGGGSIAWVDEAGALQVGPRSAEANPGPVFYDRGGEEPTVGDADLIAGRLNAEYLLGGTLHANKNLALKVIQEKIAGKYGWNAQEAAVSIIDIIDNKMAYAIRSMTVEKGLDPADFVMIAFGGGGALHASSIAGLIGIPIVIVPLVPGNFSALGMLSTDIKHDFARTCLVNVKDAEAFDQIDAYFRALEKEADKTLESEGIEYGERILARSLDLRYVGQEYSLNVSVERKEYDREVAEIVESKFNLRHEAEYGFYLADSEIEIANLRVTGIGRQKAVQIKPRGTGTEVGLAEALKGTREIFLKGCKRVTSSIYEREKIPAGSVIDGPAVIEEPLSATLILPNDHSRVDEQGNIIIEKGR